MSLKTLLVWTDLPGHLENQPLSVTRLPDQSLSLFSAAENGMWNKHPAGFLPSRTRAGQRELRPWPLSELPHPRGRAPVEQPRTCGNPNPGYFWGSSLEQHQGFAQEQSQMRRKPPTARAAGPPDKGHIWKVSINCFSKQHVFHLLRWGVLLDISKKHFFKLSK